MASLNLHDLQFILKQIEISEAHAAGTPLTDLIDDPLLPFGVRTVDGTYNNLTPGRETWGAADQPFPGMLDPDYINDGDGDSFDADGPGPAPAVTNTDYAQPGNVADADPRIISNLIVDQTSSNPAALMRALQQAGSTNLLVDAQNIIGLQSAFNAAETAVEEALETEATALGAFNIAFDALSEAFVTWPDGGPEYDLISQNFNAAQDTLFEASGNVFDAETAFQTASEEFNGEIEALGLTLENDTWVIENEAPDENLSAPFNSWMTLFGQFFDHGLDLVAKGQNGTVYVPLQPDDPLYVEGGHTNFMVITRTTASPGADGVFGTADDVRAVNLTTPFIDQNQTYTSHASHQAFLREYTFGPDGKPIATGNLLNGQSGIGLPTWADIKANALEFLGIKLTDADVTNIPLLATDEYGNFIPGANGYAQIVMPGTPPVLQEGSAAGLATTGAVRTGHAFLDDIAHNAAPVIVNGVLVQDADDATGNAVAVNNRGQNTEYDNELLDKHFITGDGRGNENIGLTAVHHIFHSEHNRQIEEIKETLASSGDPAFLEDWYLKADDGNGNQVVVLDANGDPVWDGERLFQAARFATEMQYQHLVFEEFARKIQPDIDLFVFNAMADINPAIVSEFADVVYRFGHSMLRDTVASVTTDAQGNIVQSEVGLIDAFLNPVMFAEMGNAEEAAGAIIRGMTAQVGNEIDEFVTDTLRNNLLGLPLDLATINIARARENGVPSLNQTREQFFELTGDTQLKPYDSWTDFAYNIKNPASIINFVAAYGTHSSITDADTLEAKRLAATKIVMGGTGAPADRTAFLNSTGSWATAETGLNQVDLWVGGLAEKKMPFGGMLGSTFAFVFETTMENLQNGDRFYYLSRTQGLNFLNELEANTFASLVMRNTTLGDSATQGHLPGDIFSVPNYIIEMNQALQINPDPVGDDPVLESLSPLVVRGDHYLQYRGNDHVVLGGTEENDILIAGGGDDTIWGDGGDDTIEAGYGVDRAHGGDGDDVIRNSGTDIGETDFLHGGDGNDVIHGGSGLALLFGEDGNDFLSTGKDGKEAFGGEGNDFILGGEGSDFLLGNEGDDWIEAGNGFDTTAGDNSELFFNSRVIGHDVMFAGQNEHDFDGESGDDIMVQGESVMRNNGMAGFDWAIHKGSAVGANSDLGIPIFVNQPDIILRDRFDLVEGLSGWVHDDVLTGASQVLNALGGANGAALPDPDSPVASYSNALTEAGVARIDGLRELLSHIEWDETDPDAVVMGTNEIVQGPEDGVLADDILLGGGGSDRITGRMGNDIIDGDAWLNVRISIRDENGVEIRTVDSLAEIQQELLDRTINPGQLHIVREILHAPIDSAVDTAVYSEAMANYDITHNADGSITVSHARVDGTGVGPEGDGVDTVRNIEQLQFADQLLKFNRLGTGAPVVSITRLTQGHELTAAVGTIADLDGFNPAAVTWQWQAWNGAAFANIPGAVGSTFTPAGTQVGMQLRVTASYTDGRGFVESASSTLTGNVGELMIGTAVNNTRTGTIWDDDIYGRAGNDNLVGNNGDDWLFGEQGADNLNGGAGNDLLDGGIDADRMTGGTGDDTYHVDNAGDVVIETSTSLAVGGNDTVVSTISHVLGNNVENLVLSGSGDINGTGNALVNTIYAGAGNNIIDGGAGWDTVSFENATGTGPTGVTLSLSVTDGAGNWVATGISGTDLIRNIEYITGSAFNDFLTGNVRANVLKGGGGNDFLDGRADHDIIDGGAGNDTLVGGTGNDMLTGGAGNDLFVYLTSGFGQDQVTDFDADAAGGGQDKIDLSAMGITSGSFGSQVSIAQDGADTVVSVGSDSIRLIGIDDASKVTITDFQLA